MGILFVDNGEVRTFDLNGGSSTIGRDGNNDIVVKHPTVSRHHARIDLDNGRYFLTDFSSRNGTRINGRAVTPNEPLQNGCRLRIGHIRAWFYLRMPDKLPRSLSTKDTGIVFNCALRARASGRPATRPACPWSATPATRTWKCRKPARPSMSRPAPSRASAWPTPRPTPARSAASASGRSTKRNRRTSARAVKPPAHQECWLENRGCSTYGCEQVNALVPKDRPATPSIDVAVEDEPLPTPTPAQPLAWGHMLLGLSVVSSLLGLIAFGVPAAVLAVVAFVRLLITRTDNRVVLTMSGVIALLGTAAGVLISRLWWLGVPIF